MRLLLLLTLLSLCVAFAPLAGTAAPSCPNMEKIQSMGCNTPMPGCDHCMKHQPDGKAGKCDMGSCGCNSFQQAGAVMPLMARALTPIVHGPVASVGITLIPYSHTIPYQPPKSA